MVRYTTHHVEELMAERGVGVDHSTINRWVIKYSPQLEEAFHRRKRPVWESLRMDETYMKVKSEGGISIARWTNTARPLTFCSPNIAIQRPPYGFSRRPAAGMASPETLTIDGSDANAAAIKRYDEEHGTPIAIRQVKYLHNIVA